MIRLLVPVPASNVTLERMFSKLELVKTNLHCSVSVKHLENILKIAKEGSSQEAFDRMSVTKKWTIDIVRRTAEDKRPRSYKSRNSAKVNVRSFSDDDSDGEEDNISENAVEEVQLFSFDSK